jgi:hypothetical protein
MSATVQNSLKDKIQFREVSHLWFPKHLEQIFQVKTKEAFTVLGQRVFAVAIV